MSENIINKEQLFAAIEAIATQNLLTEAEAKEIFEDAVKKAFYTKYDPDAELEMIIDKDSDTFKLINHSKFVVEDEEYQEEYRALEIPLTEAKKINPEVEAGDSISEEVDFSLYSRAIALQIRQMLTQSVREKKKEAVYAKHQSLKGEMVDVTVVSITPNYVIFTLDDNTTAFMPSKSRNMNVKLGVGQRVKVFVEDVLRESKDSQIVVSNGSREIIKRVLEMEVPEIAEGSVEIVAISRIAGDRSKVSVRAAQENIDPVGAIIGAKGIRITSIVEKLGGEKLDIILWSEDENVYVANALSPAKIISVFDKVIDGEVVRGNKVAITPNKHQTLAIGKAGSNVRLAVELTNIRIDVMSHEEALAKGIEIQWNTGLTPEDVEIIESGQKLKKVLPKTNRDSSSFQPVISTVDNELFDDQIESFNNLIEEETTVEETQENKFEIDDNLFSEEELKQMEADFEFDDEIADYQMGDEDFNMDEQDEE